MMTPLYHLAAHLCSAAIGALIATGAQAHNAVIPKIVVRATAAPASAYEATTSAAATKTVTALRNVPQIVNVVPQALMRDQNALSVQDALQNVPGLSFSVGDGQRDQVAIRGFSAITDQFIDGMRDDALYFRDLSNIERIEVLKGPASVLYGRGSAGGLIHRVSKKPNAHPLKELAVTLGSRGQRRSEFDLGATSKTAPLAWRLTGAIEDSTSFRRQYFLERQALAPSATWALNHATHITLQADYLNDRRLADQGLPSYRGRPVETPIATYFGAANGRERAVVQSTVRSATATLEHAFTDAISLHTVLRTYAYALDRNYTTIAAMSNTALPTVSISQARRVRDESGAYLQTEVRHQAHWHGVGHQLLYGVELGKQDKGEVLWSRPNIATYNIFTPVLVPLSPLPAGLAASNDNQNQVRIAALYWQDLIRFNAHWKMLAGIRFDALKQLRDDRSTRNQDLQRSDQTLAPRIGLMYQPVPQVSWYGAYSKSIQPLADSFSLRGNSDQLEPAQTVNRELGIKLDLGATASFTAALFNMSQTQIQVADPANAALSVPVGKQRTRGLELTLNGALAAAWDLTAGYAFMDGKIVESTELTVARTPFKGNTSALTPRHTLNAWLKYSFGNGYYAATGGRAESARFASPDDLTVLPGYGVIHLGAGYATRTFDVALTLKNLLSRRYFVAAHSGANDYNMPGEPRSVLVSARYHF